MEATSTRQRALDAALELFSRKGYQAVSMGDIAGALGIKAPSLYKHFKGKDELYAALFPLLEEHYAALWEAVKERQAQLEQDLQALGVLSVERLEQETLAWLQGEMDDPAATAYRRLMALGQFEDAAQQPQAQIIDRWLWAEPLALYEGLFARLIQREILRRGDPHVMAVEYLAPLFQLLARQDRAPATRATCLDEARAHIRQFHRVFAHRENRTAPQSGVGRLFRR